ncbi:hypothetical protein RYX36_012530 [Vicia faba]
MDMNSNNTPVLTDTSPITNSRLHVHSNLLPYSHTGATFSHGMLLNIPRKKTRIPEDVLSCNWLDAMKSSSPPPKNVTKDVNHGFASSETDPYFNWLLKYPSALSSFDQITNYAKGKRIALFLDYDGTLSPIVDNPDCAFMSENMRAAVKKVAEYFPTAIISGRSRDKVHEFVGLTELYYAGSHGMDIIGPVRQSLSVSLKQSWDLVGRRVNDVLKGFPRLRLTHGRKVLEVRPVINWDKGKAVTFLLESLGLNNCDDVLPIYIGDDRTDEDAFKVLREGNKGYGILVSSAPKESNAIYSLRDPSEVMEFLKSLVVWKTSPLKSHI